MATLYDLTAVKAALAKGNISTALEALVAELSGADTVTVNDITIMAGAGAPDNAAGANGDFYLRGGGTVAGNTVVYHKEAGAWVACTTAA